MAFNPERLSLLVQPIGEGGLRFFGYQTDDVEATLTAAGYATNAADYGLRAYDLVFISPANGTEEPYILAVESIDADGHATLASPGPIGDMLKTSVFPATRTVLKALDTSKNTVAFLKEAGREGQFIFRAGDYSTEIAADTLEGIYIKADAIAATAGAWVRQGEWVVAGADARWFGYVADYNSGTLTGTDNGPIIEAALSVPNVPGLRLPSGLALVTPFEIAKGKFVRGIRWGFTSYDIKDPANISGTVIVSTTAAVAGADGPTNEVCRPNQSSQLEDVLFFWHGQPTPAVAWVPIDTPWAVRAGVYTDGLGDRAERISIRNVRAYGFTHMYSMERGGEDGELINLGGQPFKVGLRLDGIHHLIRVESPDFWVAWDSGHDVLDYMLQNSIAFQIGRCDGLQGSGTWFSFGSWKTLQIRGSKSPDYATQGPFFFNIESLYGDWSAHTLVLEDDVASTATGKFGRVVANKADRVVVTAGVDDTLVGMWGLHDIEIDTLELTGPGFAYPGAGVISDAGGRLKIGHLRTGEWDGDAAGYACIQARNKYGLIEVDTPARLTLNTGWLNTSKQVFEGDATIGESNIKTGHFSRVIGHDSGGTAFTSDTTGKVLLTRVREKPVSEGAREFRVRVFLNGHNTVSVFAISFSGNANIIHVFTTAATTVAEDLDSGWLKIINTEPGPETELGVMYYTGTSGMAALTLFSVVVEFRG